MCAVALDGERRSLNLASAGAKTVPPERFSAHSPKSKAAQGPLRVS